MCFLIYVISGKLLNLLSVTDWIVYRFMVVEYLQYQKYVAMLCGHVEEWMYKVIRKS